MPFRLSSLLALLLLSLFWWGAYLFIGGIGIAFSLILIAFLFVLGCTIQILLFLVRWHKTFSWKDLFLKNMRKAVFLFLVGVYSPISIIYITNEFFPANVGTMTLTNGEKTVVFQEMAHVATEKFYGRIQQQVADKKRDGYVLYYEGVGAPKDELTQQKLNMILGMDFSHDLYKEIGALFGFIDQSSFVFTGFGSGKDKNVDISSDALVEAYDRISSGSFLPPQGIPPLSLANLGDLQKQLSSAQKKVLSALFRFSMNTVLRSQDLVFAKFRETYPELVAVILDMRNEKIAQEILKSSDQKIYALYGAAHFPGVYAALQKADPRWTIASIQEDYPYSSKDF